MNYFEGLTEESAIKARYKELAKLHHPDLGGCKEVMQEVNAQYERVITGHYQRSGKSITEIDELLAKDLSMLAKLNEILLLPGLAIELCGSWLWITGNTKEHKDKLKSAAFMWSQNKLAWYWRAGDKKAKFRYNHEPNSLDQIRYKYGSVGVRGDRRVQIA